MNTLILHGNDLAMGQRLSEQRKAHIRLYTRQLANTQSLYHASDVA